MPELTRRRFLQAASLMPLAAALPRGWLADAMAANPGTFDFFDAHQAAVVCEATARLIPGPEDDPLEAGHPGAREANVVRYIDTLLGAFTAHPPRIHAGGPWSDRKGGKRNYLARFAALPTSQERIWRARIAALQQTYRKGIQALDAAAGGDFSTASPDDQDQILLEQEEFRDLLFTHAIEGFLSVPEYGGNAGLVGWKEISFPGDSQPHGYTDEEVSAPGPLDPVVPSALVAAVQANFEVVLKALAGRRSGGR